MLITIPCVVSLVWRLEDAHGQLIDELDAPVEFFVGGDDLLAKVEESILGQKTGFKAQLNLEPEHAFGEHVPELVFFEERSLFPEQIEAGMQFDGPPEGAKTPGLPKDAVYTVTEVYPEHVVLDGNHPLAGIALRLDLSVHAVRAATEEEIEAGSVTGLGLSVVDPDTPPPPSLLH
jgi:FKBP-type peptidyl-prolyl cis-trans isomerase SlyD